MPGRQIPGRVAIFLDEKACAARFQKIKPEYLPAGRQDHFPPLAITRRIDGPPVFWRATALLLRNIGYRTIPPP